MDIITCPRRDEADILARKIFNTDCDKLKCPTPEKERVVKRHYPPFAHVDTKAIAVIVTDTRLLDPADAAKVVTVPPADEAKWQPKWDATGVAPGPK
jgi:hypothetical protein